MERVRKISNSLMRYVPSSTVATHVAWPTNRLQHRPVMGDRDRDRHKEAERERERQLVQDWKEMNTRQGAHLARSTSNPTRSKAPLFRVTSNANTTKQPTAPPRPVIRHPEPVTEQSNGGWPSREDLARFQEERRKHGYGPLRNPNDFQGVPAGPNAKAELRRSSSMSQLPSYVPFLARKPKMLTDEDLARARAEAAEREERYKNYQKELDAKCRWRDKRPPEWDNFDKYPDPTDQDVERMERLKGMLPGFGKKAEEKGVVRTKGGATISPPLQQEPLQPDTREDSYTKPRAVPPAPTKQSFRDPRGPSQTAKAGSRGLRRSSSELRLQDLLQEQQRLARENNDAQRTAEWRREHGRRPSHDVTKPTVPLKLHKKSSSSDLYMSSPAVLSTPRRSAESDRRPDGRDQRKRDPSTTGSHRHRGPPPSHSAQYSEPYFTAPLGGHGAKSLAKKKSSKHLPDTVGIYVPGSPEPMNEIARLWAQPVKSPPGSLHSVGSPPRPSPMPLSPPRMQRQLSDESSGSSRSRSRHHGSSTKSSPAYQPVPVPGASSRTPNRQNTAPLPATQGLASSPPTNTFVSPFKIPSRKASSTSIAQRREKSVDRIVIFPTDPYGAPLTKDLPDTPSLYTPTNYGPPSPTTKPQLIPPVPSLPANMRVGTQAALDAPLSTLRLSPGMKIKELGGQHTVEVSKPRGSVVAVSGFMAEIVSGSHSAQASSPPHSSKRHEHRERSDKDKSRHREERSHRDERSERGRHERREEKSVDGRRHVRQIYAPPAPAPEQVRRVYVPPAHTSPPPKRQIYAPANAIDRTRAEPSIAYGSRSPPASVPAASLKNKRSDYGNLYSGYSRHH